MCVCFGWDKDGDLLAAITGMHCLENVQNLLKLVQMGSNLFKRVQIVQNWFILTTYRSKLV